MINNRWIKRIGIALISIIAVLFILSFYISYFLNDRLPKIIAEKNDTAYNLTYEDLSFSIFNSSFVELLRKAKSSSLCIPETNPF